MINYSASAALLLSIAAVLSLCVILAFDFVPRLSNFVIAVLVLLLGELGTISALYYLVLTEPQLPDLRPEQLIVVVIGFGIFYFFAGYIAIKRKRGNLGR